MVVVMFCLFDGFPCLNILTAHRAECFVAIPLVPRPLIFNAIGRSHQ